MYGRRRALSVAPFATGRPLVLAPFQLFRHELVEGGGVSTQRGGAWAALFCRHLLSYTQYVFAGVEDGGENETFPMLTPTPLRHAPSNDPLNRDERDQEDLRQQEGQPDGGAQGPAQNHAQPAGPAQLVPLRIRTGCTPKTAERTDDCLQSDTGGRHAIVWSVVAAKDRHREMIAAIVFCLTYGTDFLDAPETFYCYVRIHRRVRETR